MAARGFRPHSAKISQFVREALPGGVVKCFGGVAAPLDHANAKPQRALAVSWPGKKVQTGVAARPGASKLFKRARLLRWPAQKRTKAGWQLWPTAQLDAKTGRLLRQPQTKNEPGRLAAQSVTEWKVQTAGGSSSRALGSNFGAGGRPIRAFVEIRRVAGRRHQLHRSFKLVLRSADR